MKILLMGNPNVGKSVVFNRLTGATVITSNYPGTTVEFTKGSMRIAGEKAEIIDVPGTYTLEPTCKAEEIAVKMVDEGDVLVNIVDATNLERSLNLTLQLLKRRKPMVVALNFWDETKHTGIKIDVEKLEETLGVPCLPTVAVTGEGIKALVEKIPEAKVSAYDYEDGERWHEIGNIVEAVQKVTHRHHTFLERLGDASVKPLTGIPLAIVVILLSFFGIRFIGEGLIGYMEPLFEKYWSSVMLVVSDWMGNEGYLHNIIIGELSDEEVGTFIGEKDGKRIVLIHEEIGEVTTKDGKKIVIIEEEDETVERPYDEVIKEIEEDERDKCGEEHWLVVQRERMTDEEIGEIVIKPDGEKVVLIEEEGKTVKRSFEAVIEQIKQDKSAKPAEITILIVERERTIAEASEEAVEESAAKIVEEDGALVAKRIDYGESFGLLTTGLFVPFGAVLPYILAFYLILSFLEDCGYLPRLAVLVDNIMHRVGLHGMAIIPMMLGLGCNVPGALSTRIMESRKERLISATLMAICIPCMPQIAIIVGLAGKFGAMALLPIFGTLFIVWIVLGMIMNRFLKGESPEILIDVPPYRIPYLRGLAKKVWMRMVWFVKEAVPWVLFGVFVVNILYTLGIIGFIGDVAAPVVTGILGLPKEAVGGLVVGFLRKDVAVGMLEPLHMTMQQIIVACVVLAMYFPCIATFAVLVKELGVFDMVKSAAIMILSALVVGGLLNLILSVL